MSLVPHLPSNEFSVLQQVQLSFAAGGPVAAAVQHSWCVACCDRFLPACDYISKTLLLSNSVQESSVALTQCQ